MPVSVPRVRPPRSVFGLLACLLLTGAVACAPALAPARLPAVAASGPLGDASARQAAEALPGRILYVRDGNLWLWERGSSRQYSEGGTWRQPSFSPDGKEIAYVYWLDNFSDIFVMSADGSQTRRLTRGQASYLPDNVWSFRPAWSPDGAQIAYVSDATTQFPVVWLMNRDGGNRRQLMTAGYGVDWADAISWSPDGKRLAVVAGGVPPNPSPGQIYVLDVAKGGVEKLTTHAGGAFDPAWSPDGDTIAYIGRPEGPGQLWLRSVDGEQEAHADRLAWVRSPVWSPDGKSLAVLAAQGGTFQIWVMSVRRTADGYEIGEPRQLTNEGSIDAMSGLSWAP